ncbi:uncharacterized protein LOC123552551 [Mercenaria mercenaria]|uniref:uncharacterized protein LOC123552551 n=1 Tax=Mercenaria mercenaria TaxID=6596 RepID=UPI00234F2A9B|nr:uncharacterized protein LOC123552551 [Mercenaria mercenaria]
MPPKRAKTQELADMVRTKRSRTNMQTSPPPEQGGSGAVDLHHNMPPPPPSEQESGVVNPPQPGQGESGPCNVWILGSSLVRGAYQRLCYRPDGINLGLYKYIGAKLLWDFMGGMRIHHLEQSVGYILEFNETPDYLIIHCGGNDIGSMTSAAIIGQLRCILNKLHLKMPETKIIWSQILPRRTWRYVEVHQAERARKRINSAISTYVIRHSGHLIKYPDIKDNPQMFDNDDTHLSPMGYDIMLNTISGAIYYFHTTKQPVFPPLQ